MTLEVTLYDKQGEVVARGSIRRQEDVFAWEVWDEDPTQPLATGENRVWLMGVGDILNNIEEAARKAGKDMP